MPGDTRRQRRANPGGRLRVARRPTPARRAASGGRVRLAGRRTRATTRLLRRQRPGCQAATPATTRRFRRLRLAPPPPRGLRPDARPGTLPDVHLTPGRDAVRKAAVCATEEAIDDSSYATSLATHPPFHTTCNTPTTQRRHCPGSAGLPGTRARGAVARPSLAPPPLRPGRPPTPSVYDGGRSASPLTVGVRPHGGPPPAPPGLRRDSARAPSRAREVSIPLRLLATPPPTHKELRALQEPDVLGGTRNPRPRWPASQGQPGSETGPGHSHGKL